MLFLSSELNDTIQKSSIGLLQSYSVHFLQNVFLINIAVRYKIKQKGIQYITERGWDGVRKGLIWMGHNN